MADFTKAMELEPDNPHHRPFRAETYRRMKQWDKAIADYTRTIEVEPNNHSRWSGRASVYCDMKQWGQAISDYSKAIELNPNYAYLPCVWALAHLGMGDTEGYRNGCAQMLDHFGQTEDAVIAHWMAWTCALATEAVEDFNDVIELAELAVKKGDISDQNLNTLGAVLYRAGKFDEAVGKLTELSNRWDQTRQYPTFTSAAYTWFFLAMAHHKLGSAGQSQKYFDLAVKRSEEETAGNVPWNRRLTLQLLRKEAAKLLGVPQ